MPKVSKVMEVVKVDEVMKVMEAGEVVSWKHRGTIEPMHASPSAGHVWAAEAVHATSAVHAAKAVATHAAHHRVGRHRWRGKHSHHDSTSDRDFAELAAPVAGAPFTIGRILSTRSVYRLACPRP